MVSQPTRHLAALKRAAELCRRHDSGETIQAIADSIGVTRQRASAILKYGRLWRDIGAGAVCEECHEQPTCGTSGLCADCECREPQPEE